MHNHTTVQILSTYSCGMSILLSEPFLPAFHHSLSSASTNFDQAQTFCCPLQTNGEYRPQCESVSHHTLHSGWEHHLDFKRQLRETASCMDLVMEGKAMTTKQLKYGSENTNFSKMQVKDTMLHVCVPITVSPLRAVTR